MARRVFFSFQYSNDIFRVNNIRKMNQFESSNDFHDHASHEKIMRGTKESIQKWIDNQLNGASVTCVLIGSDTINSEWVKYEIRRSYELKMGIFAVNIHNLKHIDGTTSAKGRNPLSHWSANGISFENIYKTYNPLDHTNQILTDTWAYNAVKDNIGNWAEAAALQVNR